MPRTLCLVMIVKNAGEDIIPVLRAIKPYIDCYCISDTGSIDRTMNFIQSELEGIQGSLYEDGWFGFSQNRNLVLDRAEKMYQTDFYLMLDDSYVLHGGEELRKDLERFPIDGSYNFVTRIFNQERFYYSARLFTAGQRYDYRVHEVVRQPATDTCSDKVYIEDRMSVLHQQRSMNRYQQDIDLLTLDHLEFPNDPRPVYYLGRTHYIRDQLKLASEFFKQRIDMAKDKDTIGSTYEIYGSMFYLALIAYRVFLSNKKDENFEIAVGLFKKCFETFPYRAEPLYYMALISSYFEYDKRKMEMFETLEKAIQLPIPNDNDIQYDIYQFKIPYMLAFQYYKNKEPTKSLAVIDKYYHPDQKVNLKYDNLLVAMNAIPPYSIQHYSEPQVVIYAGKAVQVPWNGDHFNHQCSGSEHMAVRLAEYFTTKKYRVTVFCECTGLEGTIRNVEYRHYSTYYPFLRTHYVDVLIVSRESDQLSYLKHIRNVFLWVHDLQPIGDEFQTGSTFRGLIALTEWHKKSILASFPMPAQLIRVIGNVIQPNPALLTTEKRRLQCIYASSPDRGLDILVKTIERLSPIFPTIRLVIYANVGLISPETLRIIEFRTERYALFPRTSNEIVHQAFAESDYWIYPTSFRETYCITAVEAQYYKCVCVTTGEASLTEIVGQRGVLLQEKLEEELINEIIQKIQFLERTDGIKTMYRERGHEWAEKQIVEEIGPKWMKYTMQ